MNTGPYFVNSRFLKERFNRFLPNAQAFSLAVILLVSFVLIYSLSDLLKPVYISIVLAYFLEGVVAKVEILHVPRLAAVSIVFCGFMAGLVFLLFYLMPLITQQAVDLVQNIPSFINRVQTQIMRLPEKYPQFITENKIQEIMFTIQKELLVYGQNVLSVSAASVIGLVSAMVYLFLVPMMVFFFLKDKNVLIDWVLQYLPKDRHLSIRVWEEIEIQIGNYVRGKFTEVFILWIVSYVTFETMKLNYSMLLSVLMGLSVIIPYIGATLVTIPVLHLGLLGCFLGHSTGDSGEGSADGVVANGCRAYSCFRSKVKPYFRQNSGTNRMMIEKICTRPKIIANAQMDVCASLKFA